MDPIHQFQIQNLLTFGHIGGHEIAFTNSALFMLIALLVIAALTIGATVRVMKTRKATIAEELSARATNRRTSNIDSFSLGN